MKYIITENRYYSVIIKWLNNELSNLKLYDYSKFLILFPAVTYISTSLLTDWMHSIICGLMPVSSNIAISESMEA